jgi:hypothetical protein
MSGKAIEEEAMVLAAAVFSGREARGLLGGLLEEKAARCRARLTELTRGGTAGRRQRLESALRRMFASPVADIARASPDEFAARLGPETSAIRSLVLGDLPASIASRVADVLSHRPTRPAAPAAPLRTWIRRYLFGGMGE